MHSGHVVFVLLPTRAVLACNPCCCWWRRTIIVTLQRYELVALETDDLDRGAGAQHVRLVTHRTMQTPSRDNDTLVGPPRYAAADTHSTLMMSPLFRLPQSGVDRVLQAVEDALIGAAPAKTKHSEL